MISYFRQALLESSGAGAVSIDRSKDVFQKAADAQQPLPNMVYNAKTSATPKQWNSTPRSFGANPEEDPADGNPADDIKDDDFDEINVDSIVAEVDRIINDLK